MVLKIVLADDHTLLRDGLRALLSQQADLQIVGEAKNGLELLEVVKEQQPDLILLDLSMPELDGLGAAKQLLENGCRAKIIIISMHNELGLVKKLLKIGVRGYMLKNSSATELIYAISQVSAGHIYLSPLLLDATGQVSEKVVQPANLLLSPREIQVITSICSGKLSKEIAVDLHLSKKSIDLVRSRILQKLQLRSTAELIKYAIKHGIADLG